VNELEEAEIGGQFLLGNAAVGTQPGAQQKPSIELTSQKPSSSRAYSPWAWQTVLWP
jgi:hypothetical protein